MQRYVPLLQRTPLFQGIEADKLETLFGCLSATAHTYQKNELIFRAGDPVRTVGIICSGGVQVLREDYFGNRTILAGLGAGDLFGEAFACSKTDVLPVSVVAAETCEVLMIDYRKIINTCPATCTFHSRLIENMMWILAQKNVLLNQKIEILSERGMRKKLLAYLSAQAKRAGSGSFAIPFDRQQLADYLCVDRSAMSAELSRMQGEGIVSYHKNHFELLEEQTSV